MKKSNVVIEGKTIEVVSYDEHLSMANDLRVPNYHITKPKIQCCLNCKFAVYLYGLLCCLTLDDRGYFSGTVPFGECDFYERGSVVDLQINLIPKPLTRPSLCAGL